MSVWSSALATLLLYAGCGQQDAAAPPPTPPPAVTVTLASTAEIAETTEYVGRTESVAVVDLQARVTGYLIQQNFQEGDDVKEGDLLFVIEQEPFETAVESAEAMVTQAEATLGNAESYLHRLESVREAGGVSAADIDSGQKSVLEGRAVLEERRAHLRRARIDLGYTEIYAPVSGRIGRTRIHVGNLVGPSSGVLATLVKLDPIWVSFPISERDFLELQQGTKARGKSSSKLASLVPTIRLVDGSLYPHRGVLDFQDNRVDQATGTIMVRATFPNPGRLLRPGQFVTVVETERRKTERIVIPQAAIQRDQVGPFVMLVNQENQAEIRRVELGEEFGVQWTITQGLKAGDPVISEGIQKVQPGGFVNPMEAPHSEAEGEGGNAQ